MTIRDASFAGACIAACIALAACSSAPPSAAPASSGAAGGSEAVGADAKLERCPRPVGTVRLQDGMQSADTLGTQTAPNQTIESVRLLLRDIASFGQKKGPGTDTSGSLEALRLLIQQSNCFMIADRGASEAAASDEKRRARSSNEVRQGSNLGEGQEAAADFVLRSVVLSLENKGSSGFNAASLIPWRAAGALGSSSSVSEAKVQLVLSDVRSKLQVAVAQGVGSGKNTALAVNVLGIAGRGAGSGGFRSEDKTSSTTILMQAFADAYNQMVSAVRNYKPQNVEGGPGGGGTLSVQSTGPAAAGSGKP